MYNSPAFRPGSSYPSIIPSSTSSSSDDEDNEDDLPFPTALARKDFLAPDFDAAEYLSKLHTGPTVRHQTLEDLRAELHERSTTISAELLELVNSNYTSFLSLGDELKGGQDRVEDVRVALLGFRRAVEEVQGKVREQREAVASLTGEIGDIRRAVEQGRRMLELDERVATLESNLAVTDVGKARNADEHDHLWDDLEESDEEEEEDGEIDANVFVGSSPVKLASLTRQYLVMVQLADALGRDLPFVKKVEDRISRCRDTILLDLGTAIKGARAAGIQGQTRVMNYLEIYRMLGAEAEAIQAQT